MLISPVRQEERTLRIPRIALPTGRPDPSKVAVLLNKNARRVNDNLAEKAAQIVGAENLFYSRNLEEAETFARQIVQRGYGTVVCGGGDGTLAGAMNQIHRYIDEANVWRKERYLRYGEMQNLLSSPRFGFLRLGTGNGISALVGAQDPLSDLRRMVDDAPRTRSIPLVEWGRERFFFGGAGYDSTLLSDYNWLKAHTNNPVLKKLMHSVTGYFAALFGRTLPHIMTGTAPKLDIRVTTLGRAYFIDPRRGDYSVELEPGAVIFEGPATFVGAGTTPFYGYGFKIFPFAGLMPKMMNLRIATLHALGCLANLPSFWKGHFRDEKRVFDFFVEDVQIELSHPFPFQHSGDDQGPQDKLHLKLAEQTLDVVDLHHHVLN